MLLWIKCLRAGWLSGKAAALNTYRMAKRAKASGDARLFHLEAELKKARWLRRGKGLAIRKVVAEAEYVRFGKVQCYGCYENMQPETSTLEHIIPKKHGGKDSLSNLALACQPCNIGKGSKHLERGWNAKRRTALARQSH